MNFYSDTKTKKRHIFTSQSLPTLGLVKTIVFQNVMSWQLIRLSQYGGISKGQSLSSPGPWSTYYLFILQSIGNNSNVITTNLSVHVEESFSLTFL